MTTHYTLDNYTLDESIGYLLKRVGNQLGNTINKSLAEFDMTYMQLGIFLKLLHGQANTAADLARESMCDTGLMTRALDRLEENGFVQRTRSQQDRRVIQVALTEKGRPLAGQMTQIAIDTMNHHLRDFSEEEVMQFKSFLRRMIANA
jgi:DNA-binding MarR family transcriptional regulator